MFMDEARIAANLIHPNIAQIYDISEEGGQYYIAMEYVRGEDLRRVYNQEVGQGHAIPKHIAALIVMGAAAGLDYAHRQTNLSGTPLGIVHRDVSPQNILVTYDGHVKLIDFGVAKAAGKLNQTRAGVLKGKYSYMSPEQASGDPLDGRTDIFALGITLYEITTGTRLFKRDNELETLHAVIACNVKPPSQVVPNYDSDLERIVLRALAYDVDSRYTTAGELEHDLERYLLHRGHPTSATSLAGYMQNLFAEKLADEALFGGPPWNEAATHSRRVAQKPAPTQTPTPQEDVTAGTPEAGTRVSAPGDEPTVVDPQEPAEWPPAEAPPPPDEATNGTPAEWRNVEERPEQTLPTHSQSNISAPEPPPAAAVGSTMVPPPLPPPGQAQGAPGAVLARAGRPNRRAAVGLALVTVLLCLYAGYRGLRRTPPHAPANPAAGASPETGQAVPQPRPQATAQPERTAEATTAGPHDGRWDIEAPVPMAVWLGARYLGTTPLTGLALPAGTLLLKLENRRDGGTLMRTVRVRPQSRGRLVMGAERGTLDVEGTPWAWLQMGQHPAQETPAHLELFEGEYSVLTECPDGGRQQHTVRVSAQIPARLVVRCPAP
jgi:serine/threonine-protein kinase